LHSSPLLFLHSFSCYHTIILSAVCCLLSCRHAILLPHAGILPCRQVLVSGWLRRDGLPCAGGAGAGGRRIASATMLLDPADLWGGGAGSVPGASGGGSLAIARVEEAAEYPFEAQAGRYVLEEGHRVDGDSIYCAGHTVLDDGRLLYVGGSRYSGMSSAQEREYGLDYVRIYSPDTNRMTAYTAHRLPLGTAWYANANRLCTYQHPWAPVYVP